MSNRVSVWSAMMVASLMLGGCTHSMRITNLDEYSKAADAPKRLTIRFIDGAPPGDEQQLSKAVYESLRIHPSVKDVLVANQEPEEPVDATVTIKPGTTYEGSWWNFLITFPGFLIFTHAWNGFVYEADVATHVEVALPANDRKVNSDINTNYSLRHCDFGRGAAASSGWYLPGWGGTNIIVGMFMVRYDSDATQEFIEKVKPSYGAYIANSIVAVISDPDAVPAVPTTAAPTLPAVGEGNSVADRS